MFQTLFSRRRGLVYYAPLLHSMAQRHWEDPKPVMTAKHELNVVAFIMLQSMALNHWEAPSQS